LKFRDFCSGDRGRWEADRATLTVRAAGDQPLRWFHGTTFRYEVDELQVSAGEGAGDVRITGSSSAGQPPFEQVWTSGRMCPNRGFGLGPEGFTLCDEPLPVVSCVGKRGAP